MKSYGHGVTPPGYDPCTRGEGHRGPCALHLHKRKWWCWRFYLEVSGEMVRLTYWRPAGRVNLQ